MDELKYILEDVGITNVIVILMALMIAIQFLIKLFDWFCDRMGIETKWSLKKKQEAAILRDHEEAIQKLGEYGKSNHNDMKEIRELLEKHIVRDDERTVATLRSTLYRLHGEFVAQKCVTHEGLKTFSEIGRVYEEAGGDDIYHSKLEPEVLALPIKE